MKQKQKVALSETEHRYIKLIRRFVPNKIPKSRATVNSSDMMWFLRNCSVLAHNDQSVYDAVQLAKTILKDRDRR